MDPFSQVIEILRPRAPHRCKHIHGRGDWAIGFPKETRVVFGLIAVGSCWFEVPGTKATQLRAGDFLLMTAPPAWTLRSRTPSGKIDISEVQESSSAIVSLGDESSQDLTRVMSGFFELDTVNAAFLTNLLPRIVVVRSNGEAAHRLHSVLGLIDDELSHERPGQEPVLDRLLELMLLETLRMRTDDFEPASRGVLTGLADLNIATALHSIHDDVGHPWTIATLATRSGMSRSAFAERFSRLVGVPPIEYLLKWRIALAKDALRFTDRSIADIASAIGYGSTTAFSTAFRRATGCSPRAFGASAE